MAMTSTPDWAALERRGRRSRTGFLAAVLAFLTVLTLPLVVPYLWLLVKSFTAQGDAMALPLLWRSAGIAVLGLAAAIALTLASARLPKLAWPALGLLIAGLLAVLIVPHLTLENYRFLWTRDIEGTGARADMMPSIWHAMATSLAFALGQTVIVTVTAAPAAYALSRFAFTGRETALRGLLILHAFPALALTVAVFVQLWIMGLLNSIWGVMLVMSALELPFTIFVLKSFFDAAPWDTEMSAVTDGATRFQAFRMIVLPQVRPGLIAVATFAFLRGWEEYIFVQTLLLDNETLTMSLYLFFVAQDSMGADYGLIAAVGVIYLLPVLVLYIFTQKYITQMNFGGIKG